MLVTYEICSVAFILHSFSRGLYKLHTPVFNTHAPRLFRHSTLLEPANAFLAEHPQLDVINCETVSVKLSPKCDTSKTTYVEDDQTSSHCLRILRHVA